jgi:hypothetical protein
MRVSTSGSTPGPRDGTASADEAIALTRWRSREGSICCSLASARTEASSIPATEPFAAVLSPIATATASSSSSSSGGTEPPVPSR